MLNQYSMSLIPALELNGLMLRENLKFYFYQGETYFQYNITHIHKGA